MPRMEGFFYLKLHLLVEIARGRASYIQSRLQNDCSNNNSAVVVPISNVGCSIEVRLGSIIITIFTSNDL
jgi:hypothetical protein